MTHIVGIRLTNFSRFRGTHEVSPLGPTSYAVVARMEGDDRRSNWLGKSTFVSAIRYALYGVLPDDYRTLDDAISTGEEDMAVDLELSDGSFVSRSRKRGRHTTVRVIVPRADGAEDEFHQESAESAALRVVGFDLYEYDSFGHIQQKGADRIARLKGEPLLTEVSSWVGLEKLDRVEDEFSKGMLQLVKEREITARKIEAVAWAVEDEGKLRKKAVADAKQRLKDAKQLRKDRLAEAEKQEDWTRKAVEAARCTELSIELDDLKSANVDHGRPLKIDALGGRALKLSEEHLKVGSEVSSLRLVSKGNFDGACPVLKGFDCPAKAKINESRGTAAKVLVNAEKALAVTTESLAKVRAEKAALEVEQREDQRVGDRMALVAKEVAALEPSFRYIEKHGQPTLVEVPEEPGGREVQDAVAAEEKFQDAYRERIELATAVANYDYRIRARRAGLAALEETKRRIAESAVLRAERGASERLEKAGIELSVEFRWGQETNKLATRCGQCGAEFPPTARIKQCQVCSAPRGQRVDPKPHLRLSDRSGAALDLAGVALSLAAREVVAERRVSSWGTVILDEPFAHLDEFNRRALSGHLLALVSEGVEQSFVVAHTRDVLDSLPGRIEIVGRGDWSEVRVVA